MHRLLDTPWKLRTELERLAWYPWIRLDFARNGIRWGTQWRFYGAPIIQKHRRSSMRFGAGLQLRSALRSNPLGPTHAVMLCTWEAGAALKVGDRFGMTGGSIVAAERIEIGNDVAIGANCTIIDTDFHPIDPATRRLHPADARTAPITIEDHVFVGMNSLILKGVRLGEGCVIGAGSIVTRDIPAGAIAAGNPASVVGSVEVPDWS